MRLINAGSQSKLVAIDILVLGTTGKSCALQASGGHGCYGGT